MLHTGKNVLHFLLIAYRLEGARLLSVASVFLKTTLFAVAMASLWLFFKNTMRRRMAKKGRKHKSVHPLGKVSPVPMRNSEMRFAFRYDSARDEPEPQESAFPPAA